MKTKILFLGIIASMIACSKSSDSPAPTPVVFSADDVKSGLYKSPEQTLSNGKLQTWVRFDVDNVPAAIGVTLSKGAYEAVLHNSNYEFNLPNEAKLKTPFTYLLLAKGNLNSEFVYSSQDVFYFGFHINDKDARKAIETELMLNGPNSIKYNAIPAAGILPSDFTKTTQGGIIGKAWYSTNAPEWNGKTFTHTMAIGTYNSDLIYYTPMVAESSIKASPNLSQSISITTKKGYYPNKFTVKQVGDTVEISMELQKI
jgi:hypothetical protein